MAIRKEFQETEEKLKKELETNKPSKTEEYFEKYKEDAGFEKKSAHRRHYPHLHSVVPKKNDHIYSTTRWLKRAGYSGIND